MTFTFFTSLILLFILVLVFSLKSSPSLATLGVQSSKQVIDLTHWKLTLPIGSSEKPDEIKQPQLYSFQNEWFKTDKDGTLRFKTPINGVTTKRSSYPRTELRETNKGGSLASWSSKKGKHTLFLEQAITALPQTKQQLVAGQIHDAKDDILVIRLENSKLWINVTGKNTYLLNPNYKLGERFSIKFVVNNGQSQVFYNNKSTTVFTLQKKYSNAYFKAGAYPQSNCSKEEKSLCNAQNYGEVIIYKALVTHE